MNAIILSLFGAAAFAGIGRELLKRPLIFLSAAGIIGYVQPTLPSDAVEQLRLAAAPTAPVVDTSQCSDEDAHACIMEENQRYSSQIVGLAAEMDRLFGPLYEAAGALSSAHRAERS